MTRFGKTWWGERFLEALTSVTDEGRLQRGRSYAGDSRIKSWKVDGSLVKARVRGNKNPYFGVYKEPTYTTEVEFSVISEAHWEQIITVICENAGLVSALMAYEMPEDIEKAFKKARRRLLPSSSKDFSVNCSCPDYAVPCKHIAGVFYRLAAQLDRDPLLLFELRGLPRENLHEKLATSELGALLVASLSQRTARPEHVDSFYTRPLAVELPETFDAKAFWLGGTSQHYLAEVPAEVAEEAPIPAIPLKRGGDFPAFWDKRSSFLEFSEELSLRLRKNSKMWM